MYASKQNIHCTNEYTLIELQYILSFFEEIRKYWHIFVMVANKKR